MDQQLSWSTEYAAFGVMLGLSVIVGLYYAFVAKQNTVSDYLLGGKHMSVFPITMSLIARRRNRRFVDDKRWIDLLRKCIKP